MKKLINIIAADRITRTSTIISLSLIVLAFGYTLFVYSGLPLYLPLFNQMGWGDPRLAERIFIFLPLVVALIVDIVNIIISATLYTTLPLVSRIIAITCLLISTLTLIFLVRVTQLVL